MMRFKILWNATALLLFMVGACKKQPVYELDINNIIVHDPHILADSASQLYYMYGQYSPERNYEILQPKQPRAGVQVYVSKDLKMWTKPQMVFQIPDGFWGDSLNAPWAPEVHCYNNKYYLFVTFNKFDSIMAVDSLRPTINLRASQILVADKPTGPFKPFSNKQTTPDGEMTLDATFYNEDGQPWIVYCHEWIQVTAGTIKAMRLKPDLSATIGQPIQLITSADVKWPRQDINYKNTKRYPGIVTDGPYFYKTKTGKLLLIWSSWTPTRQYAVSVAYSDNGKITGNWQHIAEPIIQDDRGHGMILTDFNNRLLLVLHRYFKQPATRVQIWQLEDIGHMITVKEQLYGVE